MAHRGGKQAAGVKQRITKAHAERFEAIKSLGCLACRKLNLPMFCGPIEAHHLLSGGRRRGHDQCIPLGKWHHQGIPWRTLTTKQMAEAFGPSLRLQSKLFHETFGSDDELLAEAERLIA
jgi:hypothetical protein